MALHSMGRKHGDPRVVGSGGDGGKSSSSIALLQERFRQLEKRREEMKVFSELETMSQAKYYEPSRNLLVHPYKPAMTARSSFQDSLSLGLDLYGKKTEHQPSKTPPFRDFWSMDSVTVRVHDKPDVDTSLHL
ncbi:hypothetical protein L1987_49416 [Smallanthus sonchifolius]|uniref:Uncharacterized protein n=1 Tax=Smallanthus sonchifolius TaxID=185202 RepID=A0ACB9FV93_9ASTR|nr:hypothetical protein L1987_49416 [Smallanthus sonchifolius]